MCLNISPIRGSKKPSEADVLELIVGVRQDLTRFNMEGIS